VPIVSLTDDQRHVGDLHRLVQVVLDLLDREEPARHAVQSFFERVIVNAVSGDRVEHVSDACRDGDRRGEREDAERLPVVRRRREARQHDHVADLEAGRDPRAGRADDGVRRGRDRRRAAASSPR
jgi:hypothetical protein